MVLMPVARSAAQSAKSFAFCSSTLRAMVALCTTRFTVPPTPSTAPFPWDVAKKMPVYFYSRLQSGIEKIVSLFEVLACSITKYVHYF